MEGKRIGERLKWLNSQIQKLQERKEYKKPSVIRRDQIQKAKYNQKNYSAD